MHHHPRPRLVIAQPKVRVLHQIIPYRRRQCRQNRRHMKMHERIQPQMDIDSSFSSLPGIAAVLARGMDEGLHSGGQVYVWRDGKAVGDFAMGESRPGVAMTTDTLTLWMSASKPVAAVAIAQLMERGRLALDDLVARAIPEFAEHGKEAVTIRHLLTHTAGLRWVATRWPQIISRICASGLEPNWTPGQRAKYDTAISWFILGEIVRRTDGRPYPQYVREEIFEPLGMSDCWIGMPLERIAAYGDRMGVLQVTSKPPPKPLAPYDTPLAISRCRPAANGQGTMRQLARLYQMLLNGGHLEGARLLSPQTVELFITPQRIGMYDETFGHIIDWGLGFLVDSKKYGYKSLPYSFGPYASPLAFGHHGFQSSMVFADPQYDLVIAIAPNGTPGEIAHDRRLREVLAAVYTDLKIA